MLRIEKSCSFVCHKWLLFAICFVLIYFDLMLILFSDTISQNLVDSYQIYKETIYRKIMVESVLSIMFCLFGIIGAFRENYCCTVLFSAFMILSVLTEIYSSIMASVFWLITIVYILITIISVSFARQLRERMIEQCLQPQSAFMRDYGRTFGLRFNSYQFFNRNSNPVIELQTIDFERRQLPPYYNHDTHTSSMQEVQPLPPYEERPPNPPSYQESVRNFNKSDGNDINQNNGDNYVQHI